MRADDTPTSEHILRILSEASEALYSSDIAARMNRELREWRAYSPVDVVKCMQDMGGRVVSIIGWAMDVEAAGGLTVRDAPMARSVRQARKQKE